jgi:hypothetical protein
LLGVAVAVDLFAERAERLGGEDGFDGKGEEAGEGEGEGEGGLVIAALEEADGLVVDFEGVGEILTREAALSAEDGDAVKETVVGRVGVVGHLVRILRNQNIMSTVKTYCLPDETLLPYEPL